METGDYFQYPNTDKFNLPQAYNQLRENKKKERFWVKMMQEDLPFKFSMDKKLTSKPICWTKNFDDLSSELGMEVNTIEETQKRLLLQSLLNSVPLVPDFLREYEQDLTKTVFYLIDLEKKPVTKDEMKEGFIYFKIEIDAELIKDKVDEDAT